MNIIQVKWFWFNNFLYKSFLNRSMSFMLHFLFIDIAYYILSDVLLQTYCVGRFSAAPSGDVWMWLGTVSVVVQEGQQV